MATLQEMLSLNDGSFQKAEQMALSFIIEKNMPDIWLDLSLLLHAQGKIEGSRQALMQHLKHFPNNPRALHALSWFSLYDGDLKNGLYHIEIGRECGILGKKDYSELQGKEWDGVEDISGKTVLLYGEGGIGDQIMCARSAKWLNNKGAIVVIACSQEVCKLLKTINGVSTTIPHDMAKHIACDYWIPSMSSMRLCGVDDWKKLYYGKYIPERPDKLWERIIPSNVMNIGLRFSGNPLFEHAQFRRFPEELMFNSLIKSKNVQYWSLQKERPDLKLPDYINDLGPLLGDWQQTTSAITRMDLVITSCTSIAHLAAAMGKPTWVIVPAMPYYPWARPCDRSNWYDSIRIFRQNTFGNWYEPFFDIHCQLEQLINPKIDVKSRDEFYLEYPYTFGISDERQTTSQEITAIVALISKISAKKVLEIGINRGYTAKSILENCQCIDKYVGVEISMENAQEIDSQKGEREFAGDCGQEIKDNPKVEVRVLPNGSKNISPDEHFDFVFIDGNHSYEVVKSDTELALKLGASIICWHDYGTEEGVTNVVNSIDNVIKIAGTRIAYLVIK